MSLLKRKQHRRYARHSTRRGASPRDPRRTKRIVAVVAGVTAVIVVALVWGNILKTRSDDYRALKGYEAWTVDEKVTTSAVKEPLAGDAAPMTPGQSPDTAYDSAMLRLGSGAGKDIPYASKVLTSAGVPVADGAPALAEDVDRVHARDMAAIGMFTVTSLSETNPAMAAYRRGLEMAWLIECAGSGLDEILLNGLPTGDDAKDAAAVAYVAELKQSLSSVNDAPAVTVVLPMRAFAEQAKDGTWTYDHRLTPGRMLTVCDGLVVNLASVPAAKVENNLQGVQYPYVRYGLRLLLNGEAVIPSDDPEGASLTADALAYAHGYERIMLRPASE